MQSFTKDEGEFRRRIKNIDFKCQSEVDLLEWLDEARDEIFQAFRDSGRGNPVVLNVLLKWFGDKK